MSSGAGAYEGRAFRLALANRLAPIYAHHDGCAAVIVGGSVARGWSDERSDLELGIFWHAIPDEPERRKLAAYAEGHGCETFPSDRDHGLVNDAYTVEGVKIDVVHATRASIDRTLDDAMVRLDPTLWKHEVVGTLMTGLPLAGAELLAAWLSRAVHSRELARTMIRQHLVFGPRAYLETLVIRGDFLLLREVLGRIERLLLGILMALNRVFTPSANGKWTPRIVASLTCAPPDFLERARRMWFLPDSEAIVAVHALIDETVALVDRMYPEVDTGPVRVRIAKRSVE